MPLGYFEFATIFNNGTSGKRRLATIQSNGHVIESLDPPTLYEFGITPEQCGLKIVPRRDGLAEAELYIYKEFVRTHMKDINEKIQRDSSIQNR